MGTNSQISSETEEDIRPPAELHVSVKGLKEGWQKWCSEHQEQQKHNPFSHDTRLSVAVPQRGQDDYGRPLQGSLTERRGQEAHTHISDEVQRLCTEIRTIGELKDGGGRSSGTKVVAVEFGKLFEHYVTISNKLVGTLLRARKQRLVEFDGEMLWQGKDDHVVISLVE
uniref:Costars domain-containing protein n=1 Tax=Nothobranchius korthausae TaxID=1143690 RepID=A0A1A8F163_9TELE